MRALTERSLALSLSLDFVIIWFAVGFFSLTL